MVGLNKGKSFHMFEDYINIRLFRENVSLHCRGCPAGGVSAPLCVCVCARAYMNVSVHMWVRDSVRRSDHRGRSAVHLLLQLHHLLDVLGLEPVCLHGVISKAAHCASPVCPTALSGFSPAAPSPSDAS